MNETFRRFSPHTVWECYSPTQARPSTYAKSDCLVRDDFCGWSALGPISLFIEDVIGIKEADAFKGELTCDFAIDIKGRAGVENYRFGNVVCSVVATAGEITVESNCAFTLVVDGKRYSVKPGDNVFKRSYRTE
jgi:hypothetical protein